MYLTVHAILGTEVYLSTFTNLSFGLERKALTSAFHSEHRRSQDSRSTTKYVLTLVIGESHARKWTYAWKCVGAHFFRHSRTELNRVEINISFPTGGSKCAFCRAVGKTIVYCVTSKNKCFPMLHTIFFSLGVKKWIYFLRRGQ